MYAQVMQSTKQEHMYHLCSSPRRPWSWWNSSETLTSCSLRLSGARCAESTGPSNRSQRTPVSSTSNCGHNRFYPSSLETALNTFRMFQSVCYVRHLHSKQEHIFCNSYLWLSQLVVMMRESQIKPSPVDVHRLAQDRASHGWTFNVPPGSSLSQHSKKTPMTSFFRSTNSRSISQSLKWHFHVYIKEKL